MRETQRLTLKRRSGVQVSLTIKHKSQDTTSNGSTKRTYIQVHKKAKIQQLNKEKLAKHQLSTAPTKREVPLQELSP
ncbi:UNVERIFIED_CONTAM: hypothetical protein FKN15_025939 [Acipenser sinensis]